MFLEILLGLSLLSSLIVGGVAYGVSQGTKKEKLFFLVYLFGVFLWTVGIFWQYFLPKGIAYHAGDGPYLLNQIIYLGAALAIFSQYLFFSFYKKKEKRISFFQGAAIALFCAFLVLLFVKNHFFSEVILSPDEYAIITRGKGIHFFVFYILFFYAGSFITLLSRIKSTKNLIYKTQFKYLLWIFLIANTSAILTNMVLPTYLHVPQLNSLGPVFYILEASFFLYATTRLRFMDLQLTAQKYFSYFSNGALYVIPFVFLSIQKGEFFSLSFLGGELFLLVSLLFLFWNKTLAPLNSFWNYVFYGSAENPIQKIKNSLKGFQQSVSAGLGLLAQGLRVKEAQFVYEGQSVPQLQHFFSSSLQGELVRDEIDVRAGVRPTKQLRTIKAEMDRYMISVALPVFDRQQKLLGVLLLKQKLGGGLFSVQEIRATRVLLEKATVYLSPESTHKEIETRLGNPQFVSKEFLNNLMHEIRTPLMMAQNVKEMIEWGKLKPEDREFLAESEESIQELTRKLDRISEAFQWQQKLIPLEKSFISLESLFDFLVREFPPEKISISVEMPSLLRKKLFLVDTKAIKSAFQEIIRNALFFCKQKNPRVQIKISQKKQDLIFVFQDNGIGIKTSQWDSVFDLLSVVAESRNPRECGLGVGLTKAKGVIEAHGGEIKIIASQAGKGTTFQVIIPCEEIKA